jgi:hypothetical protein
VLLLPIISTGTKNKLYINKTITLTLNAAPIIINIRAVKTTNTQFPVFKGFPGFVVGFDFSSYLHSVARISYPPQFVH